jgi:hypothetical protein
MRTQKRYSVFSRCSCRGGVGHNGAVPLVPSIKLSRPQIPPATVGNSVANRNPAEESAGSASTVICSVLPTVASYNETR